MSFMKNQAIIQLDFPCAWYIFTSNIQLSNKYFENFDANTTSELFNKFNK